MDLMIYDVRSRCTVQAWLFKQRQLSVYYDLDSLCKYDL